MTADQDDDRQSRAESPALITDPVELAERESRNALRQFDAAVEIIETFIRTPERPFRLRPSQVLHLHRIALDGLSLYAGNFRPAGVRIEKSAHQPPGAHLVAEFVEDMCEYVNGNWSRLSAIQLAAYAMWRLVWIHPFDDGNGRTSRVLAYVILCVRLNSQLPGHYTIPEQIAEDKAPYYKALETADIAWSEGRLDVSSLEGLLQGMLTAQLARVLRAAKGAEPTAEEPKLH